MNGLRGIAREQELRFGIPDGNPGSGLTILVGSNSAGKSTLIDALAAVAQRELPAFSEGKRNKIAGDKVHIRVESPDGHYMRGVTSIATGGSQSEWLGDKQSKIFDLLVLPSRRTFSAYFGSHTPLDRNNYSTSFPAPTLKKSQRDEFPGRIFKINSDRQCRKEFDDLLGRIVSPVPEWTVDQSDNGNYYLKFRAHEQDNPLYHSSDGIGEGLISLFFIIDSLYDAKVGSVTVIDEPEQSLHPQYQRRLNMLFSDMARDRQIVYATHSPYFVSWPDVKNGAAIARVCKSRDGTQIIQPSRSTLNEVIRLKYDDNNPHTLGLDASEVFFLEDKVILVEGPEDVIFMKKIMAELEFNLSESFYGWGVGGAEKMEKIARLLDELGYESVVGILDNDKTHVSARLQETFGKYLFRCISAPDIRPKKARKSTAAKEGIVDKSGRLLDAHRRPTIELLSEVERYFHDRSR